MRLPVRPARRTLVAIAVTAALLGSSAVVGAALLSGHDGRTRLAQGADPTVSPSPSAESVSTPTPSRTPSPSASQESRATADADAPEPVRSQPAEDADEQLKQHVKFEVSASTSGGDYPETTVSVRVHGVVAGVLGALLYTDRDGPTHNEVIPEQGLSRCTNDSTVRPHDRTFTFRHSYREAGTYRVEISAGWGACGSKDSATWLGTIDVSKSSTRSNGPTMPTLHFLNAEDQQGNDQFVVAAEDDDGFLRNVTVEWDHGTTRTETFDLDECSERGRYWPADTENYLRFPIEGTSAKVTVTSTGCDGQDAQTTTRTVDADPAEY